MSAPLTPAPEQAAPGSQASRAAFALIALFILGLTQLVAWLGLGQPDPFLTGFTVLQATALFAVAIQVACFVPAYLFQTERYYDLAGSLTYLLCTGYSLAAGTVASPRGEVDPRAVAVSAMVVVWAVRLGYFLFRRILAAGKDDRFKRIMPEPTHFFMVWALQALWITLVRGGGSVGGG
jgi:steroid 5-alpha reductase family enzyme